MINLTPETEKQLQNAIDAWAQKYAGMRFPEHDRFCMFMGARIGYWEAQVDKQQQAQKGKQ